MEQHACIPSAPASGSGRHCATYGNWKFQPFAPHAVRLGGEIRHRMDLTGEKILHHLDVEELFVRHFRHRSMKPEVPGGFAGYGMFLDAVVKAAIHGIGGDEMLRFKTERLAELIDTQSEDGAITIFSGPPGYWDNHDQAYMIQAFVLDYRHYGNERALQAALRLGNFLIHRKTSVNLGLETLAVRMKQYCENALTVAKYLEANDKVESVMYPGLESNKYHALAQKYLKGASGVISFIIKGGKANAVKFMDALSLASNEVHVADIRTCVLHPASETHRQLTDEQLVAAGINSGMVRFSVGLEDVEDILADLDKAFAAIK